MTDPAGTWPPPPDAYTLAHRCPRCKAAPGQRCDYRGPSIYNPGRGYPVRIVAPDTVHAARTDAGIRHYNRDVRAAPWPEEREPGRRYDTLGDLWAPPPEPTC